MALDKTEVSKYQKMSTAELQAKAVEIEQLREKPKAAVGFASRLWGFTKTVALVAVGAIVGKWLGNKIGISDTSNKVTKFLFNNKGTIGAAAVAGIGVSTMRGNRRDEVHELADLELAKIQAVLFERERAQHQPQITAADMQSLNNAMASGQAVGNHSQRAVANRGGQPQVGV